MEDGVGTGAIPLLVGAEAVTRHDAATWPNDLCRTRGRRGRSKTLRIAAAPRHQQHTIDGPHLAIIPPPQTFAISLSTPLRNRTSSNRAFRSTLPISLSYSINAYLSHVYLFADIPPLIHHSMCCRWA